jgi:hypothetical protein
MNSAQDLLLTLCTVKKLCDPLVLLLNRTRKQFTKKIQQICLICEGLYVNIFTSVHSVQPTGAHYSNYKEMGGSVIQSKG